jgi:hypothetical protein
MRAMLSKRFGRVNRKKRLMSKFFFFGLMKAKKALVFGFEGVNVWEM